MAVSSHQNCPLCMHLPSERPVGPFALLLCECLADRISYTCIPIGWNSNHNNQHPMYTLIVRFVNLHQFKMQNGRVCSPLGFKQITFHSSFNILKLFLLFAYHPVVWWTITCVSVAAFLLICSHNALVSIWPFGFRMCIEPSLQYN